jgi:hypothetical protein
MKTAVFCDVASCRLVDKGDDDNGGSKLLWNASHYLPDYMVVHPRRQTSSSFKQTGEACEFQLKRQPWYYTYWWKSSCLSECNDFSKSVLQLILPGNLKMLQWAFPWYLYFRWIEFFYPLHAPHNTRCLPARTSNRVNVSWFQTNKIYVTHRKHCTCTARCFHLTLFEGNLKTPSNVLSLWCCSH